MLWAGWPSTSGRPAWIRCRRRRLSHARKLGSPRSIAARENPGLVGLHGPEGDGVSALFDGRNAVLPDMPGRAGHQVERTGLRIQRETLPLVTDGTAKPELAGGLQREPEHLVEVRLVAMPSDAHAGIVFGT